MLTRMLATAARGAAVCLLSGCALLSQGLLGKPNCLGPHKPSGEWTAAELSAQGIADLGPALSSQGTGPAERAAACFLRAQELTTQDYGTNLGLGVAYLAQAKVATQKGEKIKAKGLVANAKKLLGIAYLVSQGQLEPLYYLAEVAVVEGNPSVAQGLLLYLEKVGYKLGPVYVLLGYIAEQSGSKEKAYSYYAAAIQQDWPSASASYAKSRNQAGGKYP